MRWASACTVCSVGVPAGTISQAIRGLPSLLTKSSSEAEAIDPSPAIFFTLSALRSVTTTSCPPRIRTPCHVGAHLAQTDHSSSHKFAPCPY